MSSYEMLKADPNWDVYVLGKGGKFYLLTLDTPTTTIRDYDTFEDACVAMDDEIDRLMWVYK